MAWIKLLGYTKGFALQKKNKKGKTFSDYWVTIGQHKNPLEKHYPLWEVQRGGFDDKTSRRRIYIAKRFKTKTEATKFLNDFKKSVK